MRFCWLTYTEDHKRYRLIFGRESPGPGAPPQIVYDPAFESRRYIQIVRCAIYLNTGCVWNLEDYTCAILDKLKEESIRRCVEYEKGEAKKRNQNQVF